MIGLGYVGLPLAVALARHFEVVGFDIKEERLSDLRAGVDCTREIEPEALNEARLKLSSSEADLEGRDLYIIAVPTPVDGSNRPDLGPVRAACDTVGRALRTGGIVVLESTVSPGTTEDVCGPILEKASGLACGRDFFLGYSPERINPGDRQHGVDRIPKVVAGQTAEVTRTLAEVYARATAGGVFIARSIKAAEAAKVIENAQRDVNIAFINEATMIFNKIGLSIYDVLDAARTKWNFLPFAPGLVGGHCIGVDPFYLSDLAQRVRHHPDVVLAGRRINDGMGGYVAGQIARLLAARGRAIGARILVLGLTYKENVPDLRNSKVIDVIQGLAEWGHHIDVYDPVADPAEAKRQYGVALLPSIEGRSGYDCIIGAVAHAACAALGGAELRRLAAANALIADIKGMWRGVELPADLSRWQL